MKFGRLAIIALLVMLPSLARAAGDREKVSLLIRGANIIDPSRDGQPVRVDVLVGGSRIAAIAVHIELAQKTKIIDAPGRYIVPGLWDMHAHIAAFWPPGHAPERYVGFGVLGIRDMGGHADALFALRREIAEGRGVGPTLFMAGPTLNGEQPADFHRKVPTGEEARRAVRELKKAGVDFIKIHRSTTRAAFDAIAAEAPRLGLTYCGHVPLVINWIDAANAGMHTIEHVQTMLENEPVAAANPVEAAFASLARMEGSRGDEIFAALAKNGTFFTPTLVGYEATWEDDNDTIRALKQKLYERLKPLAGRAARAGVRILAGTDVLKRHGDLLLVELERLVDAGLSPREALAAATTMSYAANGRGPGRIVAGGEASLLIVDGNPLDDVRNLRKLSTVILRGRVIESDELARLRELKD